MRNVFIFLVISLIIVTGCAGPTPPERDYKITTTEIPYWISGQPGSFQLEAGGGTAPYTWTVTGSLPKGFAMNVNGVISGTYVLAPGTSKTVSPPFTVTVTDANGKSTSLEMTLIITEPPPELLPVTGATCYVGLRCEVQVANARGGTPPYTFQSDTFREGDPPLGMNIGTDGTLMGTAKNAGTYTFGICVKDTVALSNCGKTTMIVEEEQPIIPETWTGTFGGTSEQNAHCVDGEFTYSFSVSFEYPGSLVGVLRGEVEQPGDESLGLTTRGTISASAVPTKNIQTRAKFYPDCRLLGGSYENAPLGVDASEGRLSMRTTNYDIDIVPTSYIYFTENTEPTDYGSLIFDIEESTDTTVSGTWSVGNYLEPTGSFSLVKS